MTNEKSINIRDKMKLVDLPDEMISYILSNLNLDNIIKCKLINRLINKIIKDDKIIEERLSHFVDKRGIKFYDKNDLENIHSRIKLNCDKNEIISIYYANQDFDNYEFTLFKTINVRNKFCRIFRDKIINTFLARIYILCDNILHVIGFCKDMIIITPGMYINDTKINIRFYNKFVTGFRSEFMLINDSFGVVYSLLFQKEIKINQFKVINCINNKLIIGDSLIISIDEKTGISVSFQKLNNYNWIGDMRGLNVNDVKLSNLSKEIIKKLNQNICDIEMIIEFFEMKENSK